jgi:four helix bundle protein
MDAEDLKRRTKEFAKKVIFLCRQLPNTDEARLIRGQLFRAATSVGANYRATCRGRSRADFIAKLAIVLEEADESAYWLELLVEANIMKQETIAPLHQEANELTRIFTASLKTARDG